MKCGSDVAGSATIERAPIRWLVKILLPIACCWVQRQEARIVRTGIPLDTAQLADARRLSIIHPERIRLEFGTESPWPFLKVLRRLAIHLGLIPREVAGMTFRYGVFLRLDHKGDRRLLLHELAHTAQYERLGGLRPFLAEYLYECLTAGYPHGGLEEEASTIAQAMMNACCQRPEVG